MYSQSFPVREERRYTQERVFSLFAPAWNPFPLRAQSWKANIHSYCSAVPWLPLMFNWVASMQNTRFVLRPVLGSNLGQDTSYCE
jgi:hypothetical protein